MVLERASQSWSWNSSTEGISEFLCKGDTECTQAERQATAYRAWHSSKSSVLRVSLRRRLAVQLVEHGCQDPQVWVLHPENTCRLQGTFDCDDEDEAVEDNEETWQRIRDSLGQTSYLQLSIHPMGWKAMGVVLQVPIMFPAKRETKLMLAHGHLCSCLTIG